MSSRARHTPRPLWHPLLWPGWAALGCGWVLARLPDRWLTRIGVQVGRLFRKLAGERRRVAETNLRLCFPDQTGAQRKNLLEQTFESIGISAMETLWVWLGPANRHPNLVARTDIIGADILASAQARGRGVLLVGEHLMAMDAIAPALAALVQVDVIYRYNKNPLLERTMTRGRARYFPNVIEREDARSILRSLKNGHVLWYAADQDYGRKHSVFAPFFGVTAATITGTSRLARSNDSAVVIMSQYRDRTTDRWQICFEEPPPGFPAGDDTPQGATADAQAINGALEQAIRRAPEQYLWLHRRFKTRPDGASKVYQ